MIDLIEVLDNLIENALNDLYKKDYHLIQNKAKNEKGKDDAHHVGERAIVFRFAHYLLNYMDGTHLFGEYDLDCEYNRNGYKCKSLPSFPNGTLPDIIIHKRGSNEKNLMVIEFKTYWNKGKSVIEKDLSKLKEFTDIQGKYKFCKGYFILIEKHREETTIRDCQNE